MSIIRAARPQSNFYILDKRISEDRGLTWAARGLLVFLLGKPDNWRISPEHLRKETDQTCKPTGRDGIYSLLAELITSGYVERKAARKEDGTLAGYDYIVYDQPILLGDVENHPFPANPYPAEPYPANPTLISIDVKEGLIENKPMSGKPDGAEETFDQFWQQYPNKVAKANALKAWRKIKPDASLLAKILNALSVAKASEGWVKDGGRFVPHPATWLNGKRWEDEAVSGESPSLDGPPPWMKIPEGARWVKGKGIVW